MAEAPVSRGMAVALSPVCQLWFEVFGATYGHDGRDLLPVRLLEHGAHVHLGPDVLPFIGEEEVACLLRGYCAAMSVRSRQTQLRADLRPAERVARVDLRRQRLVCVRPGRLKVRRVGYVLLEAWHDGPPRLGRLVGQQRKDVGSRCMQMREAGILMSATFGKGESSP